MSVLLVYSTLGTIVSILTREKVWIRNGFVVSLLICAPMFMARIEYPYRRIDLPVAPVHQCDRFFKTGAVRGIRAAVAATSEPLESLRWIVMASLASMVAPSVVDSLLRRIRGERATQS